MKLKQTRKPEAVIPVAAMSDIAFLLIIFFMLTSKLTEQGIDLKLPKAETAEEKEVKQMSIVVDRTNRVYYNGAPATFQELETELGKGLEKATKDEEKVVSIKGDATSQYETVFNCIDIVNKLGGMPVLISEETQGGAVEGPNVTMDAGGSPKRAGPGGSNGN